ncbi:carbon-nitrogen family hydrolase [Heyndrickxia acidiproducens]|uniref:carbon-nitrogen family hydrolase n=1 Tax=Heyndrickxia acidiproducens TaxID=1121084 RepID=UPI0003775D7A|nr:carbon-nitrogen family hydrolase [Heyndrickxia acidiproducens]
MKRKIACIQMDVKFGNKEANFEAAQKWIGEAAAAGCDLAVLPELWTTGYDLTRLAELGDEHAQQSIQFLSDCSRKYGIDLVGGSVASKKAEKYYNTMLVISRSGQLVKQYSKIHLFRLMDEHLYLTSGATDGVFQLEGETFAGVICYDIRFPEWIRKQALLGAKALFVSAEWPLARLNHWRALCIARAIENQCYVIACNRSGSDPANIFAGHSLIIDPWGKVAGEGGEEEELVTAEMDLSLIEEVRSRIPVFSDRLPDFY